MQSLITIGCIMHCNEALGISQKPIRMRRTIVIAIRDLSGSNIPAMAICLFLG